MKSVPSLSPASAPENVTPSGPFVLCSAQRNTTSPLSPLPGYSLTCCCCTFTYILNNECAIKHAGDTEVAYLWRGGKTELSHLLLFRLRSADRCNKLPWSAAARGPVYGGMWCVGHVFPGADPRSSCGRLTHEAGHLRKGQPLSWPGRAPGGGAVDSGS